MIRAVWCVLYICVCSLTLYANEAKSQTPQSPTMQNTQNCQDTHKADQSTKLHSNAQRLDTQKQDDKSLQSSQNQAVKTSKDDELEVFVDEGVIYRLDKNDAAFALYGEEYALVPLSKGLRLFLSKQDSKTHSRTLKVADSTLQIESNNDGITFYHSSKKGSNLYDKIAPKRYKLTLEEVVDESTQPQEVRHIYRIQNFDEMILKAQCAIVQSRGFIQDRSRSALMINLDKDINPRLLSQGQRELFLECRMR